MSMIEKIKNSVRYKKIIAMNIDPSCLLFKCIVNSDQFINGEVGYKRFVMLQEHDEIGKEVFDNIEQVSRKYNITTEIGSNSNSKREGGSITGKDTETANIKFVETVEYGNTAQQNINIVPDTGYYVSKITCNGENYDFSRNADGSVVIHNTEKIVSDMHYVVIFEQGETYKQIVINKIDSITKNPIENVKFNIQGYDDRTEISNEDGMSDLIDNSQVYVHADKSLNYNNTLGNMISNGDYYFIEQDGKYIPNNSGIDDSEALSYIPIDLTNLSGEYVIENYDFSNYYVRFLAVEKLQDNVKFIFKNSLTSGVSGKYKRYAEGISLDFVRFSE